MRYFELCSQWVCECSLLDLDRLKRNLEGLVAIHQYWRIGGATLSCT
ncbi:hypothetical protein ACSR4G_18345 [Acinetobacter baumannii]|nr:hypothetical protein [Acinetobacter baumannii]